MVLHRRELLTRCVHFVTCIYGVRNILETWRSKFGPRRDCKLPMRNRSGQKNNEKKTHTHNENETKRDECQGEDTLAGDTADPRRKNKLHCVSRGCERSSKLFETTSSRSFDGDRAESEDNLAGVTMHQNATTLCSRSLEGREAGW